MPDTYELKLKSASEVKRGLVAAQLSNCAGVIARGKDCFVVAVKAENIVRIERWLEVSGSYLGIIGLSGSETSQRSLEFVIQGLEAQLKSTLSIRDLNFFMLRDFVCSFLAESLYNTKSEQPLGLEFVLIRVDNKEKLLNFSVINFAGESQSFSSGFKIFGCADPIRRKAVEDSFQGQDISQMPMKKLVSFTQKALADFSGSYVAKSFNLHPSQMCEGAKK